MIPRSLRLLILALLIPSAVVQARTVVMDFDHHPASGANNTITSPVTEDGLRLTNSNNFYIFGPGSNRNTGHKALAIQSTSTTATLTAQSGAPFTLLSIRLSPYSPNSEGTVTFTGHKAGGVTVTSILTTGTALAGVVRNFPAMFQDVNSVTWNMTSGETYHQFDDVTVSLRPEITIPPPQTVTENSGNATMSVSLSEPLATAVPVQWTTASSSAVAGQDFGATVTGGSFTIPAGQTSWQFNVDIVNDTTVETLENFSVAFTTTAANVSFANAVNSTFVQIASDDGVTGFPGWMAAHGLSANNALPEADPNNDGVTNIETWLFRINPAGPSPAAWLDRQPVFLLDSLSRPALRFTVPTPLPSDVRMRFEETTDISTWVLQVDRGGFGLGSLWTGTGSNRVTESNGLAGRTITCSSSTSTRNRARAFVRMKFDYFNGSGSD